MFQRKICLLFLIGQIVAYNVDKITIANNVEGSVIYVTVKDDPEVNSAFFSTEIGNECTSEYTFVPNSNQIEKLRYKINSKNVIHNNDMVRIFGVFETKDQLIKKTYDYMIDEHGNGIKQDIPEKFTEKCDCIKSETEHNFNKDDCSDTLIFKEDFDDPSMSNWSHEIRSRVLATAPGQEFVAYVANEENSYLSDGLLYLSANWVDKSSNKTFSLENCTSKARGQLYIHECGPIKRMGGVTLPPVYSAKLHTKNKFNFKYGRVEIRARMPIGDWLFPYLILQPINTESEDENVNHIRIAYARGNMNLQDKHFIPINGETLFGSAVLWTNNGHTEYMNAKSNLPKRHFGEKFHNYTLIWHEDRIIFKVDGFTYGTITNRDVLHAFSLHECFIVLGLTAGGAINFRDDYVLAAQKKDFHNTNVRAADLFSERTKRKSWVQPNLVIDSVYVYTTHVNYE